MCWVHVGCLRVCVCVCGSNVVVVVVDRDGVCVMQTEVIDGSGGTVRAG